MHTKVDFTESEYILQALKKALYWHENKSIKKNDSDLKWKIQKTILQEAIKMQKKSVQNEKN